MRDPNIIRVVPDILQRSQDRKEAGRQKQSQKQGMGRHGIVEQTPISLCKAIG